MQQRGAYGFMISGPLAGHRSLRALAAPCGEIWLGEADAVSVTGDDEATERHVSLALADGSHLDVRREEGSRFVATLHGGPTRTLEDLAHPYLAPIAALAHRWQGSPALHGAALRTAHGAFALVAGREQGKTTTAAALVESGAASLLSDDLVVVVNGEVLPGPRTLDLRPSGSELLGLDGDVVRHGERVRRLVDDDTAAAPLVRCFHLRFGDEDRLDVMSTGERLAVLKDQLYWPTLTGAPRDLLGLASLPHVILTRRRGPEGLAAAQRLILEVVSGQATGG